MKRISNQSQGKENPLGYAPIVGLLRKFAIPSIISMLVNAAYNITDQIFIGHVVGMLGNAATNVAFPIVTLTVAFSQLVGVGTASNFNISLGAEEEGEAKNFIGTGLTLMSVMGILIMCIVLTLKTPILTLCGATENVLPYSQMYLGITALGIPFLLFSSSGSHLIRADGSPAYSMVCTVVGAVLNVFLDWLFMFIFKWGIQGAAVATITGQIISFILCLYYFTRFRTFKIKLRMLGLRVEYIIRIAKLGISNFINQVIMMLVNIIMNNTLTHYGALSVYGSDIPLAVSGVIAKLNSILSAFSVGLAQGSQPILGFNMGAKNYSRVKETYKKALSVALAISIAAFLLFQLFPRQIVSIFGSGDELYFQFAERYMRIFMMMVCVFGVQPLTVNYFTGTGNMRQGIVISLSRQGFFLIPLLILLPMVFGLDGVLYAGPIADFLACVFSLTMVFINFKKLTLNQSID
ncbi:MAG: MATE family efflux transporter [Eubacteriales bacterium]|nr:MATE family efflux transporter [Eubacteriales bacterium]